ncbi:hypothetical protein D770_10445 [Flammeovirgaceae bacterium 311]|nr:hypothetical protein D770_10445 [Flammeovirgaceae bacterium 311]
MFLSYLAVPAVALIIYEFNDKALEQKITHSLITVPEAQEDLQAMTFYSWLKARLHKRPFYEVLLETVQA